MVKFSLQDSSSKFLQSQHIRETHVIQSSRAKEERHAAKPNQGRFNPGTKVKKSRNNSRLIFPFKVEQIQATKSKGETELTRPSHPRNQSFRVSILPYIHTHLHHRQVSKYTTIQRQKFKEQKKPNSFTLTSFSIGRIIPNQWRERASWASSIQSHHQIEVSDIVCCSCDLGLSREP